MIQRYWNLCGALSMQIKAPDWVIKTLENSILLHNFCIGDVSISLEWHPQKYKNLELEYWKTTYQSDDIVRMKQADYWFFLGKGFFMSYQKKLNQAYFFVDDDAFETIFMYSYPLLQLLIPVMTDLGYAPLHAAAIGTKDFFVLVPGKQNTGKSTTSASWVLEGGKIVTDDMCLVDIKSPTIVKGFYPTIRLREESLPLLFKLNSSVKLHKKDYSKYFFNLLPTFEDQFTAEAPVKAIFCLKLDPSTTIKSANAQLGFEYLASSLAYSKQHDADIRLTLQVMKKITREVPVYQLSLSPNLADNVTFLQETLNQLA